MRLYCISFGDGSLLCVGEFVYCKFPEFRLKALVRCCGSMAGRNMRRDLEASEDRETSGGGCTAHGGIEGHDAIAIKLITLTVAWNSSS